MSKCEHKQTKRDYPHTRDVCLDCGAICADGIGVWMVASCEHEYVDYEIATQIDTCRDCGAYRHINNEDWTLNTIEITVQEYEKLKEKANSLDILALAVEKLIENHG